MPPVSSPSKGRNGVLPTSPATTKKSSTTQSNPKTTKAPAPRLRLIIRRLPPGLTELEFWTCIGDEWKVGAGRSEWAVYREGKISKDPSKPSKPGRAYLKLKEQSQLDGLSAKVKQTTFQDGKNTTKDPCLLGPPSLEFAPFSKISGNRVRHDGRQGTIDQDQEFIDFLQSLTEPITKPATNGAEGGDSKQATVTTTPLIQYLKEKKAAKAKDAALAKSTKSRQEAKEAKAAKADAKPTVLIKNPSSSTEKARVAKATQEAVKIVNKSVTSMAGKTGTRKSEQKDANAAKEAKEPKGSKEAKEVKGTEASASQATTTPQPPVKRERERGSASAAARMLQRDLGILPKESRASRALRNPGPPPDADTTPKVNLPTAATPAASPATAPAPAPAQSQPQINPSPATQAQANPQSNTPTGPRKSRTPSAASTKAAPSSSQRPSKSSSQPSSGSRSAFLKHANASQGITEELLKASFEVFGLITKCEIDRKKGFGYIDFVEPDSLKKAIAASPVKVANGQVMVLENKSKPQSKSSSAPTPAKNTPTAQAQTPTQSQSQPSASTSETPITATTSAAATPASPVLSEAATDTSSAAPATSKHSSRSGGPRGSRGGHHGSNRGGTVASGNRGSSRGPRSGGRGNQGRGKGGGGSAPATTTTTTATPSATAISTQTSAAPLPSTGTDAK